MDLNGLASYLLPIKSKIYSTIQFLYLLPSPDRTSTFYSKKLNFEPMKNKLLTLLVYLASVISSESQGYASLAYGKMQSTVASLPAIIFSAASYGKSFTNEGEYHKINHEIDPHKGALSLLQEQNPFSNSQSPPLDSLQLTKVTLLAAQKILLSFNQSLDSTFVVIPDSYTVNGQTPSEVNWGQFNHQVILSLDQALRPNENIQVYIKDLYSSEGFLLTPVHTSTLLRQSSSLGFKDLVINEIMPGPKSINPLPYAEYVEIFNPSSKSISLGGFVLKNAKRNGLLPEASIAPGEYLILCPVGYEEAFGAYGKVIPIQKWPRYVNGGDKVFLYDESGIVIDSLSYSKSSYQSSRQYSGGLSLEVVNPYFKCDQSLLLRASEDAKKGSPGKQNSVYDNTPDQRGPMLLQVKVIDSLSLELVFDENIASNLTYGDYPITPFLAIKSIFFKPGSQNQLFISLEEPIKEKTLYKIELKNLFDCSGNSLQKEYSSLPFQRPSIAIQGDIIINELLFNPRSGSPKFVEIYNNSPKFINLQDWKLANLKEAELDSKKVISTETLILAPFDYMVFCTDLGLLYQEYPKGKPDKWLELSSLPSYPIAGGTVVILSPEEEVDERFTYSEDLHHPLLQDSKGVSLERISPIEPALNPDNWHSASSSVGFASPGYKNSHFMEGETAGMGIIIEPKVFLPEAVGEQPFTTLNYILDKPGYTGTIRIYSTQGMLVRTICSNALWGAQGFYTWNGLSDQGARLRPGYYVVLTEMVHPSGQIITLKDTVVIGSKIK